VKSNRNRIFDETCAATKSLPVLTITSQQLIAIADPAVPIQELARIGSLSSETAGRPIRLWSKDPRIARRINDALQTHAEPY